MPEIEEQAAELVYGCEPKPKSKYSFEPTARGVKIIREGGLEHEVYYESTYIKAGGLNFGLYNYPKMVEQVGYWFADKLITSNHSGTKRDAGDMIQRAISGRLKPHWDRMVKEVAPPMVRALARQMWGSVRGDAAILHRVELYDDPQYAHVLKDLNKYHACRMVAKSLENRPYKSERAELVPILVDNFVEALNNHPKPPDHLETLKDWRGFLTPTIPYKALNKTLDKLPRAISVDQLPRLALLKLEQPLTDRLHLIFALSGATHHNWGLHEHLVLSASAEQIKEACRVIGFGLTSQSRTTMISDAASYILDYPEPYNGDISGLARRSVEWHRTVDKYKGSLPEDHALPIPQGVDLDWLEGLGIRLLKTAGEVYEEGSTMRHCVGSYASKAARGQCFLFHVEREGESATIEVSNYGKILQAYGFANSKNKACNYGSLFIERHWPQMAAAQPEPSELDMIF